MEKIENSVPMRADLGWVTHNLFKEGVYYNTGEFKQQLYAGPVKLSTLAKPTELPKSLELLEYEVSYVDKQGKECQDQFDIEE